MTHLAPAGIISKRVTPIAVEFLESRVSSSDGREFSWSSVDFGDASDDRMIVVVVHGSEASGDTGLPMDTVTIGGVSASLIESASHDPGAAVDIAFYWAAIPTGTSGDIVTNFKIGSPRRNAGIGVWAITGSDTVAVYDTATDAGEPLSVTIDLASSGVLLAATSSRTAAPASWTGPTEDYDDDMGGVDATDDYASGASQQTTAQSGYTVANSVSGASSEVLAAVSFAP